MAINVEVGLLFLKFVTYLHVNNKAFQSGGFASVGDGFPLKNHIRISSLLCLQTAVPTQFK